MKINELKRIAKENDYKYEYDESCFRTRFKREVEGYTNKISINERNENHMWISNDYFCDEKDFNMIKATMKYAATPLEDRVEEKKFYLKHRWMRNINGFSRALKIDIEDGTADVGIMCPSLGYKNQFTKKEIEEIKEKFNTDLADFEEVEV